MAFVRVVLAAGTVIVCALASGGAATAHGMYLRSAPDADARLARAPTEIRVEFSEPPDPRGSELRVLDTTGARVDLAEVSSSDAINGLRVGLKPVGEGGYIVIWTVASTVDGHTTQGSFAFAVGSAPLPRPADLGETAEAPHLIEIVGRVVSYLGIALAIGTAFLLLFVLSDSPGIGRDVPLLRLAGTAMAVGSLVLIVEQGTTIPARLGGVLGLRAVVGIVLVTIASIPLLARMRPITALAGDGTVTLAPLASDRPRRVLALACGLTGALTATLVSHSAASDSTVEMGLDFVHVVAASVWVGGVVALIWLVLLRDDDATPEAERRLGTIVWRFSMTALVAVALLLGTGTLQALRRLVLVEDLVETPYGIALSIKIVLLLVALAFGALNLFRWRPRSHAMSLRTFRRTLPMRSARSAAIRASAVETAVFAGILVATAFLTALVPPAQPSAAAYDVTHRAGELRLQMLAANTSPGLNRFVLRVHRGLAPVRDAEKVLLRFTLVEHEMGVQELVAAERAPGEYVANGSPTSMFGTWRVEAIVRLQGRMDVHSLFTMPVLPSAGTSAGTTVSVAGPYTMIVFADPPTPVARAPLVINVVLVDGSGTPVSGKLLRATFEGPSSLSPLDAREETQTGTGRYLISIPGLDAGTWTVVVSVGAEATVSHALTVMP